MLEAVSIEPTGKSAWPILEYVIFTEFRPLQVCSHFGLVEWLSDCVLITNSQNPNFSNIPK